MTKKILGWIAVSGFALVILGTMIGKTWMALAVVLIGIAVIFLAAFAAGNY